MIKGEMGQKLRILLVGSTGYLGRILMASLQQISDVVPTYRSKPHFADSYRYDFWRDSIHFLFILPQIDIVIIAASMAYEAAQIASDSILFKQQARRLIQECQHCRVIYISSDGVFDGKKGYYSESDIPTPMTLYGKNLQYLEEQVQNLCSDYCIIRPSYLYGYSLSQLDPRLSLVQARLLAGERLTYFTDMIKSPMEVNQTTEAISFLACSKYIGIVHVAGGAMSVYDFYREAMSSLSIPSELLCPSKMPKNFMYPKNTSLNSTHMKRLTNIEPLSVRMALVERNI